MRQLTIMLVFLTLKVFDSAPNVKHFHSIASGLLWQNSMSIIPSLLSMCIHWINSPRLQQECWPNCVERQSSVVKLVIALEMIVLWFTAKKTELHVLMHPQGSAPPWQETPLKHAIFNSWMLKPRTEQKWSLSKQSINQLEMVQRKFMLILMHVCLSETFQMIHHVRFVFNATQNVKVGIVLQDNQKKFSSWWAEK